MAGYFKHIVGYTSDFTQFQGELSVPNELEYGGFLLCLEGETDIIIDSKQYKIKKNDMAVAFPYTVVNFERSSDDFQGVIIGADINFYAGIQIPGKSSYFTAIKEHPCVSLTDSECDRLMALRDMLTHEDRDPNHPLRMEIDDSILRLILFVTAGIYSKRKPIAEQKRSRNDIIFHSFIFLLYRNFKTHRNLEYYATKQHITPSHLSKVIKTVSGKSAMSWISHCVIMHIKNVLINEHTPINRISEDLNFPNTSFFSQYFKKYAGVTPRQFRDSAMNSKEEGEIIKSDMV